MDFWKNQKSKLDLRFVLSLGVSVFGPWAQGAIVPVRLVEKGQSRQVQSHTSDVEMKQRREQELAHIRGQMGQIEQELIDSNLRREHSQQQVFKIQKLLQLQNKEIELTERQRQEVRAAQGEAQAKHDQVVKEFSDARVQLQRWMFRLSKVSGAFETIDGNRNSTQGSGSQLPFDWASTLLDEMIAQKFSARQVNRTAVLAQQLRGHARELMATENLLERRKAELEYLAAELQEKKLLLAEHVKIQKQLAKMSQQDRIQKWERLKGLRESETEIMAKIRSSKSPQDELLTSQERKRQRLQFGERLAFPVEGPVLTKFGQTYDAKLSLLSFQKGITIGASPMSPIYSVSGGQVVFSGPLKHYGKVVILKHPGEFYTLYGQLGEVRVAEGEVIASRSVVGTSQVQGTPIYFEMRDRNVALNPMQWMEQSRVSMREAGR